MCTGRDRLSSKTAENLMLGARTSRPQLRVRPVLGAQTSSLHHQNARLEACAPGSYARAHCGRGRPRSQQSAVFALVGLEWDLIIAQVLAGLQFDLDL